MSFLILLITIIFVFIAFSSPDPSLKNAYPLVAFFMTEIKFITTNIFIFLLGYIVLVIFFIQPSRFEQKHKVFKRFILASYNISQVLFFGLLLSYVALYFVAFSQLNIQSVLANINPKLVGIIDDRNVIAKTLLGNGKPPLIFITDAGKNKEIYEIAKASSGKDSFYGTFILSSVPEFLVVPYNNQKSTTLLVDNTLIISKVNDQDVQIISPVIAFLLVKRYFPDQPIKSFPKVSLLTKQEYLKKRQIDNKKDVENIALEIKRNEENISSTSALIKEEELKITEADKEVADLEQERALEHRKCLALGKYVDGKFQRTNSKEFCEKVASEFIKPVEKKYKELADLKNKLADHKEELENYKTSLEIYKAQKGVVENSKQFFSFEFGAFAPKDTIKIALKRTSPKAIADYFETLVHEYLHYTTYEKGKHLRLTFFHEGLTEYFARQVIRDNLNISTNLGYPAQVKILAEIAKSVDESDLADIYFNKDQTALETVLNRVYGEDFYQKNETLFGTLHFARDKKQAVKIGNSIMKKIKGNYLIEKDLVTNYSELE